MNKEQTYFKALVIIISLWSLHSVYKYITRSSGNLVNHKVSHKIVQSISPQIGQLRTIHTSKLNNQEIRARLGRSTWTLLHTMAASYPAFPTLEHKRDTLQFIYLLSSLFPCGECAGHFQRLLSNLPPEVGSHDEFVQWLCKAHNVVNKRLNKPNIDCTKVEGMWSCGCAAE